MDILYAYMMRLVGTPYKWGGSNSLEGLDCSGLVQELLASCGMDPKGDQTAQGLYDHFEKISTWNRNGIGALCFYGKSCREITHVAMMIDNYRVIEAGGGDHLTLTFKDAATKGAMVRIRHMKHRQDLVATLKPVYGLIGCI